jgi:hypothetical protein
VFCDQAESENSSKQTGIKSWRCMTLIMHLEGCAGQERKTK